MSNFVEKKTSSRKRQWIRKRRNNGDGSGDNNYGDNFSVRDDSDEREWTIRIMIKLMCKWGKCDTNGNEMINDNDCMDNDNGIDNDGDGDNDCSDYDNCD